MELHGDETLRKGFTCNQMQASQDVAGATAAFSACSTAAVMARKAAVLVEVWVMT